MAGCDRSCFWRLFRAWPARRWLDYRQLLLALGLLCEPARWYRCVAGACLLDADAEQPGGECTYRLYRCPLACSRDRPLDAWLYLGGLAVRLALTANSGAVRRFSGRSCALLCLRDLPGKA